MQPVRRGGVAPAPRHTRAFLAILCRSVGDGDRLARLTQAGRGELKFAGKLKLALRGPRLKLTPRGVLYTCVEKTLLLTMPQTARLLPFGMSPLATWSAILQPMGSRTLWNNNN